jgi:hypothetical protein
MEGGAVNSFEECHLTPGKSKVFGCGFLLFKNLSHTADIFSYHLDANIPLAEVTFKGGEKALKVIKNQRASEE